MLKTISGCVFQKLDLSIFTRKVQNESQHQYLAFSSNEVPVRFLAGLHDPPREIVGAAMKRFEKTFLVTTTSD